MRLAINLFVVFAVACASKGSFSERTNLSYSQIRKLTVGQTLLYEVEKAIGKPTVRSSSNEFNSFRYDDPSTGAQRLAMRFSVGNDVLTEILWVPFENESEYQLTEAKVGFKESVFREFHENENNPHMHSKGVTLLIDETKGITIRYNQDEKRVEAIAIYSLTNRIPSNDYSPNKVPYSLGEKIEPGLKK